jgi:leucyl/phenylalanyl-tRNA---protein transferase
LTVITPQILLKAYAAGVFPMAENANDPALYWMDPEERGIIPLRGFHISRSLRKAVKHRPYEIKIDSAFDAVLDSCAENTPTRRATWINSRIKTLYNQLAEMGHAHSVEAWFDGKLVGGLYGVRIGAAFFGESMFSRMENASKICLVHLVARLNAGGFTLLDAQFPNDHLKQFGTLAITKQDYHVLLNTAINRDAGFHDFERDHDPESVLDWAQTQPLHHRP